MPTSNMPEIRHMRSGSLSIAAHSSGDPSGMTSPLAAANRFDGPRSPPNTSHVPCKFFRQGACQAGNACPFSHDLGHAAETVCKYFAKGNCKFGPKCANIHVLPDGRRINYGKNGVTIGAGPIQLGSRVNPSTYHQHTNSALTNSFMRGEALSPYTSASQYGIPSDYSGFQLGRQPSMDSGLPTIDTTYSSNPTSVYGSPRDDETTRFGLGLSPVAKGLSVLDAPLPASFDSNGISHAARYGPWPASVPNKFGLESPSHSLNAAKDGRTSDALKALHTSAFGSSDRLGQSGMGGGDSNGFSMGSSPPVGTGSSRLLSVSGAAGEEYFGRRPMHSSSLRYTKPRLLSSSAPKVDHEWEPEFLFEEDYIPGTLANEVLTPAEKARRGSATNTLRGLDDNETSASMAVPASGLSTNFGSASAGSPSRWGPLFQRQREEELSDFGNSSIGAAAGSTSRSMKHAASAFGHVGSPLRNSSLASGLGAELMNNGGSGSPSARPGAGSRSASGADLSDRTGPLRGDREVPQDRRDSYTGGANNSYVRQQSLSALTQQLRQTSLDSEVSPHLHPNAARNGSVGGPGTSVIGRERERDRALERHVSSGSIGSSVTGRFTTPIDEEDSAFVFSMEDEEEGSPNRSRRLLSLGQTAAASPLGNGWSYASAVADEKNGSNGNGAVGARDNGNSVEAVGGK